MTVERAEAPLTAFAPAKINLSLHVTGQRADGYHLLESLVVFANVGDRLSARKAEVSTVAVTGPRAAGVPDGPSNLVLKAADWAGRAAAFTLEKHLPAAAGIGGGSSDAAAALRLLESLYGRPCEGDLAELGADVPVCAYGRACVMRGVGEKITPVRGLPRLPAVLVNPGVEVATPAAFGALAQKSNPVMPDLPEQPSLEALCVYLSEKTRNDLQAPAIALAPVIGEVIDRLWATEGALLARMSGSGASCFALLPTMEAAEAAARSLRADRPDWWVEPAWLA